MKPRRIILIRHGECHANNDESKFATEPDYTIELTPKGVKQARQAGHALKELLGDESVYFYISPFWRTRSTFENIVRSFPRSHASMLYDTPKTQSAGPRVQRQQGGKSRSRIWAGLPHGRLQLYDEEPGEQWQVLCEKWGHDYRSFRQLADNQAFKASFT
uniref:phosphoglycerate mutase family protein n=1 Tax=Alistipes sp. Marseille-P5061 TaxID=2048242 RepID=UPI000D0EC140|nr:phosphoglycerate mutase family protein [Alistipes sp. Marseille-P5061]